MSTERRPDAENWPAPHKAPKPLWPRLTVESDQPAIRWTDRAACAGRWDLFDAMEPGETRTELRERVAAARAICARCPVLDACATYARTVRPPVVGILAGRYFSAASTSTERSSTP